MLLGEKLLYIQVRLRNEIVTKEEDYKMKKVVLLLTIVITAMVCLNGCDVEKTCEHTTKLGVCSECGEYQNEYSEEISEISSDINWATKALQNGVAAVGSSFDESEISVFQVYVDEVIETLEEAETTCLGISELSSIRTKITNAKNEFRKIKGSTVYSYYSSMQTCVSKGSEYLQEAIDIMEDISTQTILG